MHKSIFPNDNKLNKILWDFIRGKDPQEIVSKYGAGNFYPLFLFDQIIATGSPVVSDCELKRLCDYHFFFQEAARMRRKFQINQNQN
jgi:hypothetical protein